MNKKVIGLLVAVLILGAVALFHQTLFTLAAIYYLNTSTQTNLSVDKNVLQIDGLVNSKTPQQIRDVFATYPNIDTIEFIEVLGSVDDEANLEIANWLIPKDLTTKISRTGYIASGGTDLFLVGDRRVVEEGATIGVHSWSNGKDAVATDFARDHKYHKPYIAYYVNTGMTQQQAEDFYFFTINAAPANDIHKMSIDEIKQYKVATNIILDNKNIENSNSYDLLKKFDGMLSEEEKEALYHDLNSDKRKQWSNLPAAIYKDRPGLKLENLTPEKQEVVLEVLSHFLSKRGFETIKQIILAEKVLSETNPVSAWRFEWGEDNYWFSIFGKPDANNPWAFQFGGHHLALNFLIHKEEIVMSPIFIGIEPANYSYENNAYAPLQENFSLAQSFIQTLSATEKAQSKTPDRPKEVYAGPQKDDVIPPIEGVLASTLSKQQQQALLQIVALWIGLLPEEVAMQKLATISNSFDNTYFIWHGSADGESEIYYRIQSPKFLIEFSTEGKVGSDGGHYHSVYRNLENDYGINLLK